MRTNQGVFVGRRAELARLRAELDEVLSGRPRLVWLEGEAGAGKTALMRRFLGAEPDLDVLWATGERHERNLPFGLLDLLGLGGPAALADGDPSLAGQAACVQLRRRASQRPVVVAADDAHWADEPSLEAMLFAARRLAGVRVLWVLSARPDVPVPDFEGWRGQFGDPGRGTRLVLRGLEVAELRALAAALAGAKLTPLANQRLRDICAGNPRYARLLIEDGGADALNDPASAPPVPSRLSLEVRMRLAELPPDVVRFVEAVAVLGEEATRELAARVAEVGDPVAALDAARAAGLLRPGDRAPGSRLAFSVPLVGAAVVDTLAPGRFQALHRRAAADAEGLTALRHQAAGASGATPELAAALREAASADCQVGFDVAASLMRAAADLSPEPAARQRSLLLSLLLMLRGGDGEGAQQMRPAAGRCRPGPLRDLVLGALDLEAGRLEPADVALVRALDGGRRGGDALVAAAAAACLVRLRVAQGRLQDVPGLAEGALAASPALPAVRLHVAATWLWGAGGLRPGAADLSRVKALLRCHPAGGSTAEEHLLRGLEAACRHEPAAAAQELEWALQAAGPHAPGRPPVLQVWLADAAFAAGLWDRAEGCARGVAGLSPAADPLGAAAAAHALLARLCAARGAWERAEAHLRVAGARRAPWMTSDALDLARAELAHLRGRPDVALAALAGSGGPGASAEALVLQADALLRLGATAEAREAVARVEAAAARAAGSPWLALAAARLRGELEEALRNEGAALAAFEVGMLGRDDGCPLACASLELAYGRLLWRAGRPEAAARVLQAARERLELLGATAYLAGTERELWGCGAHPRRIRDAEGLRLTAREREVALLAAAGYTNREIGQRLHVSVKAVEYHVSRVLAKLELSSRRELRRILPGEEIPSA